MDQNGNSAIHFNKLNSGDLVMDKNIYKYAFYEFKCERKHTTIRINN